MSRPKTRAKDPAIRARPGLRVKVYVRDDMVGGGKLQLLRLVEETGSISGAAKALGVDYKRAWFLLDTLQRCFEDPLFITHRGRQGAELTALGRELLTRFEEMEAEVAAASADFLTWLEARQRQGD